jgi:hypothetical protein
MDSFGGGGARGDEVLYPEEALAFLSQMGDSVRGNA